MSFTPATLMLLANASAHVVWLLVAMSWALLVWNARRTNRRDRGASRSEVSWPSCEERPDREVRRPSR